jgi:lipopolysaccharide exporter
MPYGSFARNVATLTGATAFSQLVVLAALPVLTRLFDPGAYGAAAVYASIVGLVVVVGTFRYELAIPLPRHDAGALHVAVAAFLALVAVTICAGLLSPFVHAWLNEETGLSEQTFSILVVVGVLTAGIYQVTNYWAVRKSKFGSIARTRIQQGLAGTGSQLVLGFAGFGALGLIVGVIIGQCAGVFRLAVGMFTDCRVAGLRLHRRRLCWAISRYRRFPLFDSWAGLLNVAGGQAPVLVFALLFSPVLAGYYALAYRILSAPLGLVGKAVSQVLLPRIVEANRYGQAGTEVLKLLSFLATLALPPFAIIAVVSFDLVPIAFGAGWSPAASVVAWTAIWAGWQFIGSPLSVVLIGIEAQMLNAVLQAMLLVLRISALMAGVLLQSAEFALAAFSVASLIGYAGFTFATGLAVNLSASRMLASVWRPVVLAAMGLAVAAIVPEDLTAVRYGAVGLLAVLWLRLCWRIVGPSILRQDETDK